MKNLKTSIPILAFILMTIVFIAATTLAAPLPPDSAGTGNKRETGTFSQLDIEGAFEVTLVQGNNEFVLVDAADDVSAKVFTRVEGGVLKIYASPKLKSHDRVMISVHFKNLNAIGCSGAIVINSSGALKFDKLSFDASGACKTAMELTAASLEVDISGAGNATLKGSVSRVDLDISGAGKFMAGSLEVDDYEIDISGTGNAEVNAAKTLDVAVSGTGTVRYNGDPKITKEVSGTGNVTKIQ